MTSSLAQLLTPQQLDSKLLPLLVQLIQAPSLTPNDVACQQLIFDLLSSVDFKAYQANSNGVTNTLFYHVGTTNTNTDQATATTNNLQDVNATLLTAQPDIAVQNDLGLVSPVFCFAGHTDVVPVGQAELWQQPPFSGSILQPVTTTGTVASTSPTVIEYDTFATLLAQLEAKYNCQLPEDLADAIIFGRGATDMKGGLASAVVASYRFVQAHPDHPGTVCLLVTSDEEGIALDGTKYVVEQLQRLQQPLDYCIVGEPSSAKVFGDTIRIGRRGSATFYITVQGVQGHVAYPHLVANPIHKLALFMHKLAELQLDTGSEAFPASSLQIVDLHAGDGTTNLVPGICKLAFNIRFNNLHSYASLQQLVTELLQQSGLDPQQPADSKYQVTVSSICSGESFVTNANSHLVQTLQQVLTHELALSQAANCDTGGGTSDGRFIAKICPQVVEFGTTNETLHKVNEHINYQQARCLTQSYYAVLQRILLATEQQLAPAQVATSNTKD